tara:strand:+ start:1251 stop:2333 length:1083 start_codon:yes stop_codon:yes gene_type:complete
LKKTLTALLVILAVLGAGAWLLREQLMIALMATRIAPQHDFDPALAPAPPDYRSDSAWAALPEKDDPADDQPGSHPDSGAPRPVGVFFVHPTSYFGRDNWNQPLADASANWITDNRVLRHQASVFNACCEVFAPRYRQATFFSYLDDAGNGERALDLAYTDVAAAFEAFLARNGDRPFILAGHSQGSQHGARLLRERIAGSPAQSRMVAAYLVGFALDRQDMGGLPVCATATATGCVIGWNTVQGESAGLNGAGRDLVCVNPLSWRADGAHAPNARNSGGIGFASYTQPAEGEDVTAMAIEPQVADAQCRAGNLVVRELRSDNFPSRMPGNSMHVYDYSLYYLNVRANAVARVDAFLSGS